MKRYDADMVEKLTFFDKADVNGANARETYTYVKSLATNSDGTIDIRWNFGTLMSNVSCPCPMHEMSPNSRFNLVLQ